MTIIKFTTTLSSATPAEFESVIGIEFWRSQGRRKAMSRSTAFIWKCVPRTPHTWKSWWLWPAEGAIELCYGAASKQILKRGTGYRRVQTIMLKHNMTECNLSEVIMLDVR